MIGRSFLTVFLTLAFGGFFFGFSAWRAAQDISLRPLLVSGRVVPSAPVLVALYGGDRYLAANLETIRLSSTGVTYQGVDTEYLVRSQGVVAELNACNEDNFYLANGLLTWGGAVSQGNQILRKAMECRKWDYVPAFFYGVNLAFFQREYSAASDVMRVAASRSPQNAVSLERLAISLQAETFSDEKLALSYLVQQRDTSSDLSLKSMLDKRVIRLQGLVDLRAAQRSYEKNHGALTDLNELVNSGELDVLPQDPLNLGYELRNGRIELGKLRIAGMEEQP